jgi:hypothetical protein
MAPLAGRASGREIIRQPISFEALPLLPGNANLGFGLRRNARRADREIGVPSKDIPKKT